MGYSFWGFLGSGISDTPDGGRSHRLTFLKSLVQSGCEIFLLQRDRDRLEAHEIITVEGLQYHSGFPELDILFLEYRWEINGRNCNVSAKDLNYTPDLDRQKELIKHYEKKQIPIVIWDKDQKLDSIPNLKKIVVFEAALFPRPERRSLFFPMGMEWNHLAESIIPSYQLEKRLFPIVYIGNQYERDESLKTWIDLPAKDLGIQPHIYGNWTIYPLLHKSNKSRFPQCFFKGKLAFSKLSKVYQNYQFTVLIAPERYYETGQFTQRLFESLCNLCIPLVPSKYRGVEKIIIPDFIIKNPDEIALKINFLRSINKETLISLIRLQIERLKLFSVDAQIKTCLTAIAGIK